ncbi:MAG: flagellar basal-body rod protein FlgG [Bdellovibrionales bacterium RIFOXYC1_FULL_54_43]|nr:MAG: flagellar basal-body rod protein FlgG [Bdellovibrionales bacterium RIFOXYC1_FULL_54_43]OFZ81066.1 MAG: flagellar basal-body rod protein FlgG [Bdellovibrionales bacterium RIFOXYD1_FULL_55_31]
MIRALTTSATGLEAQQANIERISNDLANVNTDGYKRSRTEFHDLMYETTKEPGGSLGAGTQSPVGIQNGLGVKVGTSHKIFEQGPAKMTYHPYDLMIEGRGFFPVQLPNGEIAYTRNGAFHIDAQGRLQTAQGAQLIPQTVLPSNALNVTVGGNGEVKAALPNQGEVIIAQIQLITFPNEQGLMAQGDGLYKATLASGAPVQGIPGENGLGSIQQGAVEGSNVNVANSMVDMIATQRAYEMGTKVMGVADQMWGATANIK